MKLCTLFLSVLALAPQEKITLKFQPKVGDKISFHQKMSMEITMDVGGQELTMDHLLSKKVRSEVTAVEKNQITGAVLQFDEDIEEQTPPFGEPQRKENPLHGKRVVARQVDGKIEILEPKDLDAAAREAFTLSVREVRFLPKQPVGVGETWEIKGEELKGFLGNKGGMKSPEGKITLTLKEIKEIDQRRCAVIGLKFDLRAKSQEEGPAPMNLSVKMEGDTVFWIDRGYPLSMKVKGEMSMKMGEEDGEIMMTGKGPMKIEMTAKVE